MPPLEINVMSVMLLVAADADMDTYMHASKDGIDE